MNTKTTFEKHIEPPTCTINAFWDTESARFNFEEFTTLQQSRYSGKIAIHCFGMEPPAYSSELFDMSKCTYKDFRAFCIENPDYYEQSAKDVILEKVQGGFTWEEYAIELLDKHYDVAQCIIDGDCMIANSTMRFGIVSASGSCQGDYALVLHKLDAFSDECNLREVFSNLLFSAPAYISIEYEDGEILISNYMPDPYEYDKGDVLKLVAQHAELNDHYDWIAETLPEYLDCI